MQDPAPRPSNAGRAPSKNPASSKQSFLLPLAFLALVAIGGSSVWYWLQLKPAVEAPPAPAPKPAPAVVVAPPAPPPPAPETAPAEEPPVDPRQRGRAALGALLNSPQVQQLANNLAQSAADNGYAGLFQQLNLPPDQSDQLRALLAQRLKVAADAFTSALNQGTNFQTNQQQLQAMVQQGQDAVDQNIHSLLGDSGYQQYQTYNNSLRQNPRALFQGGG